MRILKGFKSFVLEVRNLKGLGTHFSQVQILKEIGERELKVKGSKLKEERFGRQLNVGASTALSAGASTPLGARSRKFKTEGLRLESFADAWVPHPRCFVERARKRLKGLEIAFLAVQKSA